MNVCELLHFKLANIGRLESQYNEEIRNVINEAIEKGRCFATFCSIFLCRHWNREDCEHFLLGYAPEEGKCIHKTDSRFLGLDVYLESLEKSNS